MATNVAGHPFINTKNHASKGTVATMPESLNIKNSKLTVKSKPSGGLVGLLKKKGKTK